MNIKDIRIAVLGAIDSGLDQSYDPYMLEQPYVWHNESAYKKALHYLSLIKNDKKEYKEHCESIDSVVPHESFIIEATRLFEWLAFENIDWETSDIGLLNGEWAIVSK